MGDFSLWLFYCELLFFVIIPAGETLRDLLISFVLFAGDIDVGSLELILRLSGTGVLEVSAFFSLVSLEALEKTPCIGLH